MNSPQHSTNTTFEFFIAIPNAASGAVAVTGRPGYRGEYDWRTTTRDLPLGIAGEAYRRVEEWNALECLALDELNAVLRIAGKRLLEADLERTATQRSLPAIIADAFSLSEPPIRFYSSIDKPERQLMPSPDVEAVWIGLSTAGCGAKCGMTSVMNSSSERTATSCGKPNDAP